MRRTRNRSRAASAALAWLLFWCTNPATAQYLYYPHEKPDYGIPPSQTGRSPQQHAHIIALRQIGGSSKNGVGGSVEVSLSSDAPFDSPNGEQLMLIIGAMHFYNYRYDHGNRNVVIFTIDKSSFDALPNGSMVKVGFGLQRGMRWDAGMLNKTTLGRY
jgi:hypothetical protein